VGSNHLLDELDHNWEVLAEPIQTVMRRYGIESRMKN
jgi:adenylosuccinate lyase